MTREPESVVLELLPNIRADLARADEKVDNVRAELRSDIDNAKANLRSEILSLRADVAADLATMRKETSEQIRRAVAEYHSAVLGHGILISDLGARLRRMEQHLGLSAMGAQ